MRKVRNLLLETSQTSQVLPEGEIPNRQKEGEICEEFL